jgi:polar amino acid transport system substrate-binding protein
MRSDCSGRGRGGINDCECSASCSTLPTVLDRGKLIVGTGSTNAPWHFEDEKGQLTGMDIAIARILSKGLFDDVNKVEFVKTVSPARAQLVHFSRPDYVEGVALLTSTKGKFKTHKELIDAGANAKASVLQNVDADQLVKRALPMAQVLQLDTRPTPSKRWTLAEPMPPSLTCQPSAGW